MKSHREDLEWARAYARQALADLQAMDFLRQSNLPECQHLHFLQMACEKICKAYMSQQQGHEHVRKIHGYVSGTLPVIVRSILAKQSGAGAGLGWLLPAVRRLAAEIELLAPACHAEETRPDNSEYPWRGPDASVVAPCDYEFHKFSGQEQVFTRLIRVLREAATEYASEKE